MWGVEGAWFKREIRGKKLMNEMNVLRKKIIKQVRKHFPSHKCLVAKYISNKNLEKLFQHI